jgi:hypothetical protein
VDQLGRADFQFAVPEQISPVITERS